MSQKKFLFVDDETTTQDLLAKHPETLGFEPSFASTGQEGMVMIEQHQFERIYIDLMMPFMDGWELLNWIRRHPVKSLTWVAIMTSAVRRGENPNLDTYLFKPDAILGKPISIDDLR